MKTSKIFAPLLALGLVSAPIAAQAATPIERSSASLVEENELRGGGFGPAVIIALLAGAGMLALILTDDDDDDAPVSV